MEPTELQAAIESHRRFGLGEEATLGDRLKTLRGKITQEEFAKRIGYSRSYLRDIEYGRVKPSRGFLVAVSAEFNVSIDWLLTGTDREAECSLLMAAQKERNERILKKVSTIGTVISLYFSQALLRSDGVHFSLKVGDWENVNGLIDSLLDGIREDVGKVGKTLTATRQLAFMGK